MGFLHVAAVLGLTTILIHKNLYRALSLCSLSLHWISVIWEFVGYPWPCHGADWGWQDLQGQLYEITAWDWAGCAAQRQTNQIPPAKQSHLKWANNYLNIHLKMKQSQTKCVLPNVGLQATESICNMMRDKVDMFQVLLSYHLNLELNLILQQMHSRNVRSKTCTESFYCCN